MRYKLTNRKQGLKVVYHMHQSLKNIAYSNIHLMIELYSIFLDYYPNLTYLTPYM